MARYNRPLRPPFSSSLLASPPSARRVHERNVRQHNQLPRVSTRMRRASSAPIRPRCASSLTVTFTLADSADSPEVLAPVPKIHCRGRAIVSQGAIRGYCRLSNLPAAISPISSEFELSVTFGERRYVSPESNELGELRERGGEPVGGEDREIDAI